jgi:hypothetical protein
MQMTEKLKLNMSDKIRRKVKLMMKKMKFSNESLFVRYCLLKTYRPYATAKEKLAIDKENKLIRKYEEEHAKKK